MRRDIGQKEKVIEGLRQNKNQVQKIKDFLSNIDGSDEARRNLLMAEWSILEAMHQIKLIEEEDSKIQSESSER